MRSFCMTLLGMALGLGMVLGVSTALADPLHEAAAEGDIDRVARLLDRGAALESLDASGEPALILASLEGHTKVVRLLLDRGASVSVRNKGGLTPLHAAAYGGHVEVAALLVGRGAQVNESNNFYRMSPLHAAAEEGRRELVGFLLAQGAEIEAEERNGYTPLTQAGWREYWETADLLMRAGAACQSADLVGDWLYQECTRRK